MPKVIHILLFLELLAGMIFHEGQLETLKKFSGEEIIIYFPLSEFHMLLYIRAVKIFLFTNNLILILPQMFRYKALRKHRTRWKSKTSFLILLCKNNYSEYFAIRISIQSVKKVEGVNIHINLFGFKIQRMDISVSLTILTCTYTFQKLRHQILLYEFNIH